MIRRLFFLFSMLTLLAGSAVAVHGHEGVEFLAKIEAATASGELTAEEALLYKFFYVFEQEKLPADLRPSEFAPLKCATPFIILFEQMRDQLSPATVATIEGYLYPAAGEREVTDIYISPSGHFQLNYFTTGPNAVPATDVDPPNGIPDFVEKCASYLDYSWAYECDVWGFQEPPVSGYYQIFFEAMSSTYGYCTPLGGAYTNITLHNTFLGFPPNDDPEGDQWGAAKVTCAHEFKHASQMATSYWSEGGWVEVDAVWAEEFVYDVVNDYYNYLPGPSPIVHPETPLNDGGTGTYEDCVWQIWQSETWGNQFIVDFWNWRRNHMSQGVLYSYEQILNNYGSTFNEGWGVFTGWNYATGTRAITGVGYEEAADYPAGGLQANIWNFPGSTSGSVDHLAANFIRTINFSGYSGVLQVDFNGQNGAEMTLTAIVDRLDGTGYIEQIPLDSNNDASHQISEPVDGLEQIGLVVGNSAKSGSFVSYSLDVDIGAYVPVPEFYADATSVSKEMAPNQTDTENMEISNTGEPGSVLNYTIEVTDTAPTRVPPVNGPGYRPALAAGAEPPRPVFDAPETPLLPVNLYPGDCVFGNDNLGALMGQYSTFWQGNESYAFFVRPHDTCSCSDGFNVRAVHMYLHLSPSSSPEVQAHLVEAVGGPSCFTPGSIIDSSPPMVASGYPSTGYYDVEIPCDFDCRDMDNYYFLVFEFLDANGPVGIAFDNNAQTCVNYVNRGSGWEDLDVVYNFFGDIFIWADVDCCSDLDPLIDVTAPNGGEAWTTGEDHDITWTALGLADVKIDLSRNGGTDWEPITASTPNDGVFTWAPTLPQSGNCLVRISSLDDVYTDVSDAPFTLYQPPTWLTVDPSSGDLNYGETDVLDLDFDTAGLVPDTYSGYIVITHDAPDTPYVVPVTLVVTEPSGVGEGAPLVFRLDGNYPNPFNPLTTISFTLPHAGPARLDVFDLRGRVVRTIWQGHLGPGTHEMSWDGKDGKGRTVAAGTYFARLLMDDFKASCKMVLAK